MNQNDIYGNAPANRCRLTMPIHEMGSTLCSGEGLPRGSEYEGVIAAAAAGQWAGSEGDGSTAVRGTGTGRSMDLVDVPLKWEVGNNNCLPGYDM